MGERLALMAGNDLKKIAKNMQDEVNKGKNENDSKVQEQKWLEEFAKKSPVFSELVVFPFLKQKGKLKSSTLKNIQSLVRSAAAYYGYNHDANLINTVQGVLNIETKQLEPRNGRIFDRVLPHYDPRKTAPNFTKLLNNYNTEEYPDLSEDLLKLFGYALFGNNKLKTFFIAHGNGDNAKSTLWNLVENALGSFEVAGYSSKVGSETFTVDKKNSQFNVGLLSLNNSRFIFADEMKQGIELNGTLIKQLVAGENSTIKFEEKQNKQQVSANIISPVMMLVNDVPDFKDADQATINRTALIEFKKQFVRNDDETEKMIDSAMEEQAGIFNMILNAYDPDWTVPERWIKDAHEMIDNQTYDDDIVYNLGEALKVTVEFTHDTKDEVRKGELHQELKDRYYNSHGLTLPPTRLLAKILQEKWNIGLHGNKYTRILITK